LTYKVIYFRANKVYIITILLYFYSNFNEV
jgi:hypothetical protein